MAQAIPGTDPFSKSFSTNISEMYTDLQAKFDYLVVENKKLKEELIEARKGQATGMSRKPVLTIPDVFIEGLEELETLKECYFIIPVTEDHGFKILN